MKRKFMLYYKFPYLKEGLSISIGDSIRTLFSGCLVLYIFSKHQHVGGGTHGFVGWSVQNVIREGFTGI